MVIDDFLFEPCGYSMNGVTKNGCYMTIHITPEPDFSYVSFETNIPSSSYREIIQKVLDTFNPGKFTVTIFANQVRCTTISLLVRPCRTEDQSKKTDLSGAISYEVCVTK
ncbi:unnamed protein product [Acanthoscelides obtectus]|uniref:S-adenosylmethionine decarboxylase proenzyme n=1 Tax=Acanthoscelides obtectus TaxID=200917 RepID=A0A9P0PE63_ACAOB|nr:unnamed protein product [Acanthoscelides obtectus]CAK1635082.1 S-adenosylmethionine decarboxylase proenzyme [Acanthoscelides obtectus]